MNKKIEKFLAERQHDGPCLVVDLDVISQNYKRLRKVLPLAEIYYAVKANPAPEILKLLVSLGSSFDAASIYEVEECLAAGAAPERLSFGNTIKKQRDIAEAYARGVRLYAFDSEAELKKLAESAPGSRVFCRIFLDNTGAQWPLSGKFGCSLDMARDLMIAARDKGLDPYGISFHVGSQQTHIDQWEVAIGKTAMLFSDLSAAGIDLRMINLGGGFPVRYRSDVSEPEQYADLIMKSMTKHFGNRLPAMIIEPGRAIAAEAGVIDSEVVLVSRRSYDDKRLWVYLDIGKYGGLVESMDGSICYDIKPARHIGGRQVPVVLAGPTCDGADVIYDQGGYTLPANLQVGDRVRIFNAGAYTTTYSSVGFNGFPPLASYYI